MTKFAIVSDIHLDTQTPETLSIIINGLNSVVDSVDAIIIAGDIVNGFANNVSYWANKFFDKKILDKCIVVHGNHDHWGYSFENTKAAKHPFMKVLDCEVFEFNGLRIFGGTLWYPYSKDMERICKRWPDMAYIAECNNIFLEHSRFIEELSKQENIDIVISHHLPTFKSVHPTWVGATSNMYFVSNQDKLIEQVSPKVWIHGHTHEKMNYKFSDKTQVICNPCGYPFEISNDYAPLIITVGEGA